MIRDTYIIEISQLALDYSMDGDLRPLTVFYSI